MIQERVDAAIHDHERRITLVETDLHNMTPLIRFVETVQPLQQKLDAMAERSHQWQLSMQGTIESLATEMRDGMGRLNDLNEENMRKAARQVQEKHDIEMELMRQQINERDEKIESARWPNRVKQFSVNGGIFIGSIAFVAAVWQVLVWIAWMLSRHLPDIPVK